MSGVPYHAWTHLPKEQGGTDPIPLTGGDTHWMCAWNFGAGPTYTGALQTVLWSGIALSAGSEDVFTYETVDDGFDAGSEIDAYIPRIKAPGVYTITTHYGTSDLLNDDTGHITRVITFVVNGSYPGQFGAPADGLEDHRQFWVSSIGGTDLWMSASWTLPILTPDYPAGSETGLEVRTRIQYAPTTTAITWFFRTFVVYHGPALWNADSFDAQGDQGGAGGIAP